MVGRQPDPTSLRASDRDRERVVRVLRDSAVEGRLTHDSFVRRVDLALSAPDRGVLEELVADLPQDRRARLSTALRTRVVAAALDLVSRTRASGPAVLRLPSGHQPVFTIGRAGCCDLVLCDLTVSRVHARLRMFGDHWFVEDVGSTNGTRLNGLRLRSGAMVRPGDRLGLGRVVLRVER